MTSVVYYISCWYRAFLDHFRLHVDYQTAAITYFTLIASVPLLIVMSTLASLLPIDDLKLETLITAVFPKLPFDPRHILILLHQQRGAYGILGVVIAYYFAMYLISGLKQGLHTLMEIDHKYTRKLLHEVIWVNLLTVLTMAAYLAGAFASATLSTLSHFDSFSKGLPYYVLFLFSKVVNIYNLVTIFSVVLVIYHFLTPRPKKRWPHTLLVTLTVTVLMILLKKGFVFYIAAAASVNKLYATFAGVFGFLIWIFISFNVTFMGARVLYYLEHGKSNEGVSAPS